jgi:transcriptional regulator with PAS, ATPase and Fis domain
MPVIKLMPDAEQVLTNYFWPGNIRQLKNIAEQISIIEKSREINSDTLLKYLPQFSSSNVPSVSSSNNFSTSSGIDANDRELLFKVIRDMRTELNELKKIVFDLVTSNSVNTDISSLSTDLQLVKNRPVYNKDIINTGSGLTIHQPNLQTNTSSPQTIEVEETLSLQDKEIDMIKKALKKYKGKRKNAAKELGISERTLYRKINEFNIEE